MQTDMTTGNPMPIILKFTLPLLIGNLFQQFYNMVDTIIVGRFVGPDALAAVGSTGTVMFLVLGFASGMSSGFTVLTSQKYGAGDHKAVRDSVGNGIFLAIALIAIMTTLSLTNLRTLLRWMRTPDRYFEDAYAYISVICMGIVVSVFYNYFSACLRAVGNSRAPLVFLVISAVLNIFLDLLFIVGFRMGTAGAAWATNVSQFVSVMLCITYIYKAVPLLAPKGDDWRFNRQFAMHQINVGLPMALQFGITASGTVVMQTAINTFGPTAVAAVTAGSKLQNLITQGMLSMGQTMAAYCGQNYGKNDLDRVKRGVRAAILVDIVYSLICTLIIVTCLPYVLPIFFKTGTNIAEMLPYAKIHLYQCATCYFPLSLIFVFRNAMQGCGYSMLPMMGGVVEFFARLVAAVLAIRLEFFNLAVGCDPLAWIAAGIFTGIAWIYVRKDIEKKGFRRVI